MRMRAWMGLVGVRMMVGGTGGDDGMGGCGDCDGWCGCVAV